MSTSPLRVYGGVRGDDRQAERRAQLIEAGLDLLGAADGTPALTVRGACQRAGLATRYFYENFADRDALAAAVYDHVVDHIATTTLEAVNGAADEHAKIRAGLHNIVRAIAEDPRRGRLLFSVTLTSPLLAQRRLDSSRLFAALLGGQVQDFYGIPGSTRLELTTQFIVGGLAQTLTAWLDGTLRVDDRELVDRCTEIFLALAAQPPT
ncbi:hypothetical transcriptional regulator [Saccharopolyspora subtropica]|uniref:Hypothetical transcriptional regulator n=1 Tax=Saccharopolyspora thermophila TaxID=89367 RepID=A0A917NB59_9PSEU|nr:TetR/AcrR family transcriptional regulator [Saccharopolyspora subtropica]GGI84748.1 hypothetical transcriptional regulator [Saccharopolyspora subtropica]